MSQLPNTTVPGSQPHHTSVSQLNAAFGAVSSSSTGAPIVTTTGNVHQHPYCQQLQGDGASVVGLAVPPPPIPVAPVHHQFTSHSGRQQAQQADYGPNAPHPQLPRQTQQEQHQYGPTRPLSGLSHGNSGNMNAQVMSSSIIQYSLPSAPAHSQTPGSTPLAAKAPASQPSQGLQPPKPIRRRMRMITSCLECRRRKLKCNKAETCSNCQKFVRECVYLGSKLDEDSQAKLTRVKEKVGSLERQFERAVAQKSHITRSGTQQQIVADDVEAEFDDERDLEQTPMVALDLTYEDDAKDDDMLDLGIKIGKMRITERIGGLSRPRISEEISAGLQQQQGPQAQGLHGVFNSTGGPSMFSVPGPSAPDFLKPSESYLAPSSNFFMGQGGQDTPSIVSFLLERRPFDRLIRQYFDAVHSVARCVHRPSFDAEYDAFWADIALGVEPHGSTQSLVFAAIFSAAVSMDENTVQSDLNTDKTSLVQHMKLATETALSKANFLRTTRVATLQAFIMYMIPLCREEVSRSHSVLVGAAVRMAECMGLHRDGEGYGLSPLDTHVRRLIWHQLCFLDIRTCEAQGPKPTIRREDYDTKIPVNCEDEDLENAVEPPQPRESWTSTLLPLIRFEINEMMRNIWADRRKLERQKITLVHMIAKIENFRKRIFDKYEKYLHDDVPVQRYAKLVMILLAARLHAMVLHPYFANTSNPMPQRLSEVLIFSGLTILEVSIELGNNPVFSPWAWYLGAYQQYQIALLLATEMYYRPNNKLADRIWRCLDYVFEIRPELPTETKGMLILRDIQGKSACYRSLRKVRAPNSTAGAVPSAKAATVSGGEIGPSTSSQPPSGEQIPPSRTSRTQGNMEAHPPGSRPGGRLSCGPPGGPARGPVGGPPGRPPGEPSPSEANMVFAGISNGEAIWSFPRMPESPENVGDGSVGINEHRIPMQTHGEMMPGAMEFGDMEMMNTLFPHDPQTGIIQAFGIDSTPYEPGG